MAVLLVGAGVAPLAETSQHVVTVAAFSGARPAVFVDESGRARGIYPEVIERILDDLGYRTAFITGLSFSDAYNAVKSGKIDIMPALIKTPARQADLDFNQVPVLVTWSQVIVRSDSDIETITDLANGRIALQTDGQNGIAFREYMASFGLPFEPIYYPDFESASAALRRSEVDAMVTFSSWYDGDPALHATPIVFAPSGGYLATAPGTNTELLAAIDRRLEMLRADESSYYHTILDRWLTSESGTLTSRWLYRALVAAGVLLITTVVALAGSRRRARSVSRRLEQSELRFRTIFDVTADAIVVYRLEPDGNDTIVEANRAACDELGVSLVDLIGTDPRTIVAPGSAVLLDALADAAQHGSTSSADLTVSRSDGTEFPVEVRVRMLTVGTERFAVVAARDISERTAYEVGLRESLTLKETLLREIHHRVKNNLQTIASLLNIRMLSTENEELKTSLREMSDRVFAMGLLHRMLYQNDDFESIDIQEYTQMLARQVFATHAGRVERLELVLDTEAVLVDVDTALPFGLIVNEAITNSIKHGYPDGRAGTLTISVRQNDETIELVIRDDGIGVTEDHLAHGGMGIHMISMLAQQLNGNAIVAQANGTVVTIRFPHHRSK